MDWMWCSLIAAEKQPPIFQSLLDVPGYGLASYDLYMPNFMWFLLGNDQLNRDISRKNPPITFGSDKEQNLQSWQLIYLPTLSAIAFVHYVIVLWYHPMDIYMSSNVECERCGNNRCYQMRDESGVSGLYWGFHQCFGPHSGEGEKYWQICEEMGTEELGAEEIGGEWDGGGGAGNRGIGKRKGRRKSVRRLKLGENGKQIRRKRRKAEWDGKKSNDEQAETVASANGTRHSTSSTSLVCAPTYTRKRLRSAFSARCVYVCVVGIRFLLFSCCSCVFFLLWFAHHFATTDLRITDERGLERTEMHAANKLHFPSWFHFHVIQLKLNFNSRVSRWNREAESDNDKRREIEREGETERERENGEWKRRAPVIRNNGATMVFDRSKQGRTTMGVHILEGGGEGLDTNREWVAEPQSRCSMIDLNWLMDPDAPALIPN